MASTKEVKQRIKSVKNVAQITKAMEAVSATKMRKSQTFAIKARPFAYSALLMLKNIIAKTPKLPIILEDREVRRKLLVVVSSDKGLAGAFNSNALRLADRWINRHKKSGTPYQLVIVGKKAKDYFERRKENIAKVFFGFGDFSDISETIPVSEFILQGFVKGDWDLAEIVYTNFRSTIFQEATEKRILPLNEKLLEDIVFSILPETGAFSKNNLKEEIKSIYFYEYKFEPTQSIILEELVPLLLRVYIHHIILESNASEHSARMVAMKSAGDNAKELMRDLQLVYNKARQAGITRELTEITAGKEALEN